MTAAIAMPLPAATRNEPSPGLSPVAKRLLVSVGAVLATVLAGRLALAKLDAPVQQIAITGIGKNVSAEDVRAAIAPTVDAPLLQVDLVEVRAAVERIPWVASARVDRVWPAELAVQVREREVFARWGAAEALSTEGVVFAATAKELPGVLPRLAGPAGRELEVMEMYRQLADRLTETAFAPTGLALDARGDWTAATTSGVELRLGRGSPLSSVERLKNVVLPALSSRLSQVRRVDLRYANGFAVAWRDGGDSTLPTSSSNAADAKPAAGKTP